jgi:tetratricopeptide (TPR) repeat protein
MKYRLLTALMFIRIFSYLAAQSVPLVQVLDDFHAAQQFVDLAKQTIEQGRWNEALTVLERTADFSNVSSDISFLLAAARSQENKKRSSVIEALDMAIEINRWAVYDENQALLSKANQLTGMRKFHNAIECLDKIGQNVLSANTEIASDAAVARLLAQRGLVENSHGAYRFDALTSFQNQLHSAMARFPRDPRPLRILFEYAYSGKVNQTPLSQRDTELIDLALRRLPFLLENDLELAWVSASFIKDIEQARRYVAAYRSGGIHNIQNRDFMPSPGSITAALNLGLLGDNEAVEELFSGKRGFNNPLPVNVYNNGYPVLVKDVITDVYNSLASDEGRLLLTQKLHSFSGYIITGDYYNGLFDSRSFYNSGVIRECAFDILHDNAFNMQVLFSTEGVPISAVVPVTGNLSYADIQWERYPSVKQAVLDQERFQYRPVEFQFAPISFTTIGGDANIAALAFPVLSSQYLELTRRVLVLNSAWIQRPSVEFNGAVEQIFLDSGIPLHAVEILNGNQISTTEFEKGTPVMQYVDLDLDGKMETVRLFHKPGPEYQWPDNDLKFDYHRLIASSESDWTGEGRYKTGEMYLKDGSVVYSWDIDGSGAMNFYEIEDGN